MSKMGILMVFGMPSISVSSADSLTYEQPGGSGTTAKVTFCPIRPDAKCTTAEYGQCSRWWIIR